VDERGGGRLPALTGVAARFFAGQLESGWAPGYLTVRGFGPESWRQWGIGYAPAMWTALTDHARDLGFTEPEIEAAGLARRSARGTLIDIFRDRVMFPVRSRYGAVAGFIGRAPPGAAANGVPVYLNTATTRLYRKGSLLFGWYEGQPALAAGARPVIAEGPLDAIAISAAGHGRRYIGVAPCGTALTPAQVRLLNVAAMTAVIVAFDADQAGRRAAVRAYHLLRAITTELLTVPFPDGSDPAGYFREYGAAALAGRLDDAYPLADLVIDASVAKFDRWLEFTDGKFGALRAVAPLIAGLPAGQVARQVGRVAARLGLTYAEVTAAVTSALRASDS
jgi:DNA primase